MKQLGTGAVLFVLVLMLLTPLAHAAWVPAGLQGEDVLTLAEDPGAATTWYAGSYAYDVVNGVTASLYKNAGGAGWVLSNSGLPVAYPSLDIVIDPAISNTVYTGLDGGGVYRTTDGGANWTQAGLAGLSVRGLAIDAADTDVLFAATNDGIYQTADAGVNWQVVVSAAIESSDILDIIITTNGEVYAASANGLYKSTDGGSTWDRLDTGTNGLESAAINTVAVDPADTSAVYVGSADAGLFKSADGGVNWTAINTGLTGVNILDITFYPKNSTSVLAGTADAGIFRTDSAGQSWYAWNDGNTELSVSSVSFENPQGANILAGTTDGVVLFDNNLPDLIVTSVSGPAQVDSDTDSSPQITATVTIKNVGNGLTWYSFLTGLYISSDAVITTGDTQIGNAGWVTLAAGQEKTLTITGTIPRGVAAGTYYIGAVVDYGNWVNYEWDEGNNGLVGNQLVLTRTLLKPDLIVTSVSGPAQVDSDTDSSPQITVTVTIKNVGDGLTWYNFLTGLYISSDAVITTGDTQIGNAGWVTLAVGQEKTLTITGTIPRGVAAGTYYIGAVVDYGNWVNYEWDEGNNGLVGNQLVLTRTLLKPDLIVTSVSGPAQVDSDTDSSPQITVTVTIKNVGDGLTWYNFLTGLYISSDAVITTGDTRIGSSGWVTLAVGQEKTLTITGTIPRGVAAGTYYIGAVVDYGNWVNYEWDEGNNGLVGNQLVLTRTLLKPDLVVTSVSGPARVDSGTQTVTATVTIKNVGDGLAWYNFLTGLYISSDAVITTGDTRIGNSGWVTLAVGQEKTLTITGTIPSGIAAGTYYIGAVVDYGNWVNYEWDEGNNTGSYEVNIGNRPPVSIPDVASPVECQSPDGTEVTVTGIGAYDPDGDPITYEWQRDGVVIADTFSVTEMLDLGQYVYTLTVTDPYGLTDTADVTVNVADTLPPDTTAVISGTLGNDGWYLSDVDVELTATDICTGVKEVHYTLTGPGQSGSEVIVPGDNTNININEDGTYTLTYWAVDNAGNVETVQTPPAPIDREYNPPTTSPTVNGSAPSSSYYQSCVNVALTTTESESGGAVTEYSTDGGVTWQPYTGQFQICGTTTVTYKATSSAGNSSVNSVTINIDQNPPDITILNVEDDLTYALGMFNSPDYMVTDDVSGVASSSDNLTGGDGLGLGQFAYSVTATDVAGNSDTVTIHYEVKASIGGLHALITQYISSGDIDQSIGGELRAELDASAAATAAENDGAADGYLTNFRDKLNAQRDKKVTSAVADILINAATYVINNN